MTSSSFRSGNVSDDYQEESGILETETIEDRLLEAFDNLTAKSAKTRLKAFEAIRKFLSDRYMIEFVFSRKITILDSLARCLKKYKGQELGYAANLVSVICATIGPSAESDPVICELVSHLLVSLADQTIVPDVRSRCARTVGLCTYIIGMGNHLDQVMDRLFVIYSASCAKGDRTMPNPDEQLAFLHAACIQTWTLVLVALNSSSPHLAVEMIEQYMDKIMELLDSPHLDVKLSAGECLAVMCEMVKSQNEDINIEDFDDLCEKLRDLMTDSHKSRGKKDLRHQRSNFREILAYIEEGEPLNIVIKFGRERLVLDSWSKRRMYDAFSELFGNGINHHLAENEVLRDIFGLGAVLAHLDLPRVKRSDNSYDNMIADKNRTKNLRKLRDKRADVID